MSAPCMRGERASLTPFLPPSHALIQPPRVRAWHALFHLASHKTGFSGFRRLRKSKRNRFPLLETTKNIKSHNGRCICWGFILEIICCSREETCQSVHLSRRQETVHLSIRLTFHHNWKSINSTSAHRKSKAWYSHHGSHCTWLACFCFLVFFFAFPFFRFFLERKRRKWYSYSF